MRPVVTFALACAGLAAAQATLAETLRCGSVLIQPGDDAWYVLEKCGEPSAWTAVVVPVVQVELEVVTEFTVSSRGAGGFGHSGQH